jgi:predicted RNA-binding protein (virulence factor B family)
MYYVCERCGLLTLANVRACPSCAGLLSGPQTLEEIQNHNAAQEEVNSNIFTDDDIGKTVVIEEEYLHSVLDSSEVFDQLYDGDALKDFNNEVKKYIADRTLTIDRVDVNDNTYAVAVVNMPIVLKLELYFERGWVVD